MSFSFKRVSSTFTWDLRLQLKYGFYHVTLFVMLVWIAFLFNVDTEFLYNLFPFFLLSNMTITSFYFMAAMVLFEKDERTIYGLTVTPLKFEEYLLSKLLALSTIAVAESFILILVIFRNYDLNLFWIFIGLLFLSFFNSIIGFIAISKYQSINEFIIPSIGWLSLLSAPILWYYELGRQVFFIYFIIPSSAPFILISYGFGFANQYELIFSIISFILQLPLYFKLSKHYFSKYIIQEVN